MPSSLTAHFGGSAASNRRRTGRIRRDNIERISLRRVARQGGIKHISSEVHNTAREVLVKKLREIIPQVAAIAKREGRTTVTSLDMVRVLKTMPEMMRRRILIPSYYSETSQEDNPGPQPPVEPLQSTGNVVSPLEMNEIRLPDRTKFGETAIERENDTRAAQLPRVLNYTDEGTPFPTSGPLSPPGNDDEESDSFMHLCYDTEEEQHYRRIDDWRHRVQPGKPA